MMKRSGKYVAGLPLHGGLAERQLGQFSFATDTPMATVIQSLVEPVSVAVVGLLLEHFGFPMSSVTDDVVDITSIFIGKPNSRNGDRSPLRVEYVLKRTSPRVSGQTPMSPRIVGKRKLFLGQIGAGSRNGISIYWYRDRSFA